MTTKKTNPLRYACGMFGTSIPINMFRTFAPIYYVDKLGLDLKLFSQILFIYTFVDAIDNILYGYFSDRTRTKWGRRRPWLVIGAPLFSLFFILFFMPPEFSNNNSLFIYCLLFYTFAGTLDSLLNANYGALFPDLFKIDAERAKTNAFRQAFQFLAMIFGIALTPVLTDAFGYVAVAIVYGIVGASVIIFSVLGCHENPEYMEMEKPKLMESLKMLFTNKKFWIAGFSNSFYYAAMGLVMVSIPFYSKYTLKISGLQQTILFAGVLLVAIISVGIWAIFVRKHGMIKIWRAALIALAASFIPFYFANSFYTAVACALVLGFAFAGVVTTIDLVMAKIIDEDAEKSGIRREGILSSAGGFMNRLNGFYTAFSFFLASALFSFKSGDEVGPNPGMAAKFLLIVCPFVFMLLSIVFSRLLNFNHKSNQSEGGVMNG